MKKISILLALTVLIMVPTLHFAQEAAGFKALFNGKDQSGWRNPYEWGTVEVKDGEFHLTAEKKFFLVTEKEYADFIFEGEVHLPKGKANSGFMFRCHVEPNKVYGYQAEVDGSDRRWSGGLYDESRNKWVWPGKEGNSVLVESLAWADESQVYFAKPEVKNALKRNGWNKYRITCKGNKIKIEVNGVVTTEIENDIDAKGFIGIQHHGEKGATYRFRNLRIKEL
ncbi:MAG: DUF1080 domain-containing protein [Verrucomicrobiales bacterium]|nr:DUF1080 domain-containing protein [Verrucomicrobiales bacterium]